MGYKERPGLRACASRRGDVACGCGTAMDGSANNVQGEHESAFKPNGPTFMLKKWSVRNGPMHRGVVQLDLLFRLAGWVGFHVDIDFHLKIQTKQRNSVMSYHFTILAFHIRKRSFTPFKV